MQTQNFLPVSLSDFQQMNQWAISQKPTTPKQELQANEYQRWKTSDSKRPDDTFEGMIPSANNKPRVHPAVNTSRKKNMNPIADAIICFPPDSLATR